jgi:aromatic ring-opening dioxygenase LigB subunit
LSLALGRWLLERQPPTEVPWLLQAVAAGSPCDECAALGERLAARAGRVALLVMGDASARRTERSPGYVDAAAVPHDDAVAAAVAAADVDALLALDPAESARLLAAGRAAWQVLAGAAGSAAWRAELLAHEAPYGVGYLVASWHRA